MYHIYSMKQHGFTILELVIIVAILAVAAGLALLFIDNPLERGEARKIKIGAAQIEAIVEQHKALGLTSAEIAEEMRKNDRFTTEEKIIGSLAYLITRRDSETTAKDFCDTTGSGGTGYAYLKTINNNSSTGIYADTVASDTMTVTTNTDKKILCKSNSTANDRDFAVAVKVTDTIWACAGYSGGGAKQTRYFTVSNAENKVFNLSCFITNNQFTGGGTNDFFTSEAEAYTQ